MDTAVETRGQTRDTTGELPTVEPHHPHKTKIDEIKDRIKIGAEPTKKGANFLEIGRLYIADGYPGNAIAYAQAVINRADETNEPVRNGEQTAWYTPALPEAHAMLGVIKALEVYGTGKPDSAITHEELEAIAGHFTRAERAAASQGRRQREADMFFTIPLKTLKSRFEALHKPNLTSPELFEKTALALATRHAEVWAAKKEEHTERGALLLDINEHSLVGKAGKTGVLGKTDGVNYQYYNHDGTSPTTENTWTTRNFSFISEFAQAMEGNAESLQDTNILLTYPDPDLNADRIICTYAMTLPPNIATDEQKVQPLVYTFTIPKARYDAFLELIGKNPNILDRIFQKSPFYDQKKDKLRRVRAEQFAFIGLTRIPPQLSQEKHTTVLREELQRAPRYTFDPPVGEVTHTVPTHEAITNPDKKFNGFDSRASAQVYDISFSNDEQPGRQQTREALLQKKYGGIEFKAGNMYFVVKSTDYHGKKRFCVTGFGKMTEKEEDIFSFDAYMDRIAAQTLVSDLLAGEEKATNALAELRRRRDMERQQAQGEFPTFTITRPTDEFSNHIKLAGFRTPRVGRSPILRQGILRRLGKLDRVVEEALDQAEGKSSRKWWERRSQPKPERAEKQPKEPKRPKSEKETWGQRRERREREDVAWVEHLISLPDDPALAARQK